MPECRKRWGARSRASKSKQIGGALFVAFVAVVASIWPSLNPPAVAATITGCADCKVDAARRFLGSKRVVRCRSEIPAADRTRLQQAIRKCEERWRCSTADGSATALSALEQAVQAVEASLCSDPCPDGDCDGDGIDPSAIHGPVGQVRSEGDSTETASFADVERFCEGHPQYNAPPPLLALPAAGTLPEWCSEDDAYTALAAACGPPRVVFVAKGARADVADGSVGTPYPTIRDAIAGCDRACHIIVGPGIYAESPNVPACTLIEGGVAIQDGVATRGAARPRIRGNVNARGAAIILARLDIQDGYGALFTDGDVLVSQAVLQGGYEGGSSAFSATGPRICRSQIAAGYGGFNIAWHSSRLWLAGSAVSACYEGMALSWGSRGLKVLDSIVYGGHAVATSWGSVDVEVRGSRLAGSWAAVDIHIAPDELDVFPATFDVTVVGNTIASGSLPASDPTLNIVVENNTFE